MITQGLSIDYKDCRCRYCDGRGFTLVSLPPHKDHEVRPNFVIECKFCNGTGDRVTNAPPTNQTQSGSPGPQ